MRHCQYCGSVLGSLDSDAIDPSRFCDAQCEDASELMNIVYGDECH